MGFKIYHWKTQDERPVTFIKSICGDKGVVFVLRLKTFQPERVLKKPKSPHVPHTIPTFLGKTGDTKIIKSSRVNSAEKKSSEEHFGQ